MTDNATTVIAKSINDPPVAVPIVVVAYRDQAILLPFFPLMFFPEGFINGWLMTVLVAFRPHWVYSFADEDYINGK